MTRLRAFLLTFAGWAASYVLLEMVAEIRAAAYWSAVGYALVTLVVFFLGTTLLSQQGTLVGQEKTLQRLNAENHKLWEEARQHKAITDNLVAFGVRALASATQEPQTEESQAGVRRALEEIARGHLVPIPIPPLQNEIGPPSAGTARATAPRSRRKSNRKKKGVVDMERPTRKLSRRPDDDDAAEERPAGTD